MVTMADVARRAGVSVSTVSHVMNGTRPVAEATRVAVLGAIEEVGYTPNTVARSLATASTRSIGLAISAISNPYFMDLVHAIEAELADTGYMLFLADPHEDAVRELGIVRALHERRVDGLLFAPGPDSREHALRYLAEHRLPAVLVDRLASASFDQVAAENVEATATLVDHLVGLGHRRIGMIAGLAGLSTTDERIAGYRLGLANASIAFQPQLVEVGATDAELARQAVHRLWAVGNRPSALVVANNRNTIGAMQALRDLRLGVPNDVALVAFDDFEWADLFNPRLTTMAQPVSVMAVEAVRLLMSRIQDPGLPPRTIRLAPSFMHRDSCGCHLDD
jgi:LacI family transcriptional regulator